MTETLTEADLSKRWRVSLSTLRTMRQSGKSPPWFRVGKNRIRYHLQEVEAWERAQNMPK